MPRINSIASPSTSCVSGTHAAPLASASTVTHSNPVPVDSFEGTPAVEVSESTGQTALQKHVAFFDMNGDGSISVSETIEGLIQLGRPAVRSYVLAPMLNLLMGTMTRGYPSFSIDISNIKAGKHEGSSDIFDQEGKFDPVKFDELFEKFDTNQDGYLDGVEIENFIGRNIKSALGRFGVKVELPVLLDVAGEEREVDGEMRKVLTKERLIEFYDGSLFYKLAGREIPSS